MTSQQSSERTARTDRRGTVRRGLKRRGILPSFGDIVLPFVSVAAVGLLILAGRQFFLNGIRTSPGITSTRAYADSPALIAERERAQELLNPQPEEVSPEIAAEPAPAEVVAAEPEMIPVIPEPAPKKPAPAPAKKPASTTPAVKKPEPAKKPAPAAKKPEPPKKPEPAKKPASTTPPARLPAAKQWRIQVGAYPTKAGAQAEAAKIKKAGYRAEVYANPASKHVKVWVEGGPDKASASQVVKAMQALGYKGSFAFPPAK